MEAFPKLLSYFKNNYEVKEIITYADLRWSDRKNNIYTKNNFIEDHISKPNYWYITNSDSQKRYYRYNYRKGNLKNLFPNIYSDDKTEKEIMTEAGYTRIWDCGNIVYILYL